jgi:flagellar M-ring protein FliF
MDQVSKLLSGLSAKQKISIVVAALLTVGGLVGFIHWKRESDFRPLYSSMAPEDAAAVVQKLRESGVEYRLEENGGTVLAPSAKLAESRLALAAAGLPKTGRIGFELFDHSSFGSTEFVEHINYRRALEGELERTVRSLAEIEEARVHLTLAKDSIFIEKREPAKASVVLKLRPGARVAPQNVFAIANLVSSAVEGLTPGAVSIVDMSGNLLNRPKPPGEADGFQSTAESIEVRQQLERDLIAKIGGTLEPYLGAGHFRVGASIDCDLTSGEQQEETLDPSRSVMVSSQKTEDLTERASAAGGIPGASSNLPGGVPAHAGGAGGGSRRTENIAYQSSRTVRHTRIPQGVIRHMSLAILLDHSVRWEGEGAGRRRVLDAPAPETLKTIRDLVAATAGFNAERGDLLTVESLPFESTRNAEPPSLPAPQSGAPATRDPGWMEVVRRNRFMVGGGIVAIVALLFLVRGLTRMKSHSEATEVVAQTALAEGSASAAQLGAPLPTTTLMSAGAGMLAANETGAMELAARVRNFAEGESAVAANVIRLWLRESEIRS